MFWMKLHKPWLRARLSKFHRSEASVFARKRERIGRNPKTGVEVPITPRKVLVFRASHVLKDRMNGLTPTNLNDEDEL
jgi:hypothetical protein